MEFLDKLVIPQSAENLLLLNYLQALAQMIFLIYAGVLFGSTIFSVYFNISGKKSGNEKYLNLSKDMIDLITSQKSFAFGLGIVPFLSLIFSYIQLLSNTGVPVPLYLTLAFFLFLAAIMMIYVYQHTSDLTHVIKYFDRTVERSVPDRRTKYYLEFRNTNENLSARSGVWGALVLFLSLWLFIGSINLAVESEKWGSITTIFGVLFSVSTFIKMFHFITISLAITGIAFLTKKFRWETDPIYDDPEYLEFAKKFNLTVALIFTILQPVFFLFNLFSTPEPALNSIVFSLTIFAVFLIFLLSHFLYVMVRYNKSEYITQSFIMIIIVFALLIVKEQTAFGVSNKKQIAELDETYTQKHREMLAAVGRGGVEVNGEEIYKGRCMACHQFDEKLVGPPHKEVLPKYIDNEEALVEFILNPVKINPDYPPMPNQGLKPNEAEAVADYMLEHYGPRLEGGGGGKSPEADNEAEGENNSASEDDNTEENI